MTKIKSHLKDLHRVALGDRCRRGYLRLDMNENPDGLPENFVKEIFQEIDTDYLSAYPEYSSLTRKIAEHNNIEPDNICLSNGSDAAIKYIFDCYVSSQDKVLLTDPTFAMYPVYCKMFNAEAKFVPYEDSFTFSTESFINELKEGVKLAVLVNPNNPTGIAVELEQIENIAQKCLENDTLLVIDEAYFYFYDQTAIQMINKYENIIVLRTFSKLCGLASARLGYATANTKVINDLKKVTPTFDVNGISVKFAEKLLDAPEIMKEQLQNINEGKRYLAEKLSDSNISFKMGEANFILIKCPGRVKDIVNKLESDMILVSGGFKNDMLQDYIRVTAGSLGSMQSFWESFENII